MLPVFIFIGEQDAARGPVVAQQLAQLELARFARRTGARQDPRLGALIAALQHHIDDAAHRI
jgi:hypothetical protein